jgi:hypothetical protein
VSVELGVGQFLMEVGEQVGNAVEGSDCFLVTLCSQDPQGGYLVRGLFIGAPATPARRLCTMASSVWTWRV